MFLVKKLNKYLRERIRSIIPNAKSPIEIIADYIFSEAIEGDYLEFGVFRGDSFVSAYQAMENARNVWTSTERNLTAYSNEERAKNSIVHFKNDMRYFAFDSFEGLPAIKGIDKNHARFSSGRYDCPENEFLSILKKNDIDIGKVVTVAGWYEKTLTRDTKRKYDIRAASVIMVDCDLYESTRYVLDFITDIIVDGAVIIFDDWFNYRGHPARGERRAAKEWLEKNPRIQLTDYHTYGPTQKSFIINVMETATDAHSR